MTFRKKVDVNPFNLIIGIVIFLLVLVVLYRVSIWLFQILLYLSPLLLIGALVINKSVVINYGKWLVNLVKKNPTRGIVGIVLTIVGFPVVAGFLLGKAWLYRKADAIKQHADQQKYGEFADYEEVKDEPEIRLELPEVDKPRKKKRSDYDQYFE